jgi:hypothetical protein
MKIALCFLISYDHVIHKEDIWIQWINEIKDIKYDTSLVDTCLIIRTNDEMTNALFEHIYTLLYIKGLQRDQNVYNHAIHELNYPVEDIFMQKYGNFYV